ncbi:MAG TPA: translation elongation factor Ts, partial [Verrucomicrobiota bacterium]|nr:translation elongation factor Ts [Verrucomicrobiota bacterium]
GAGKEETVQNDTFKTLVRDITLQIAAANPFVVSRENVPADVLAKEKEIAAEQVKNKPPQVIEKIVTGKLEKFYQSYCLLDQGYVRENGEISVKEHINKIAKEIGDTIVVRRFVRFQVGESIS